MYEVKEDHLEKFKKLYPEKFISEEELFGRIRRGNSIFVGTATKKNPPIAPPSSRRSPVMGTP